jgi:phosphoacetylglucosamine mutase
VSIPSPIFPLVSTEHQDREPQQVIVDCANGVGALAAAHLNEALSSHVLSLQLCNAAPLSGAAMAKAQGLNKGCGSDFVQNTCKWPHETPALAFQSSEPLCCSLDGDADRVVFYTARSFTDLQQAGAQSHPAELVLLDGDYTAALIASFLLELLKEAGLAETLSIGVPLWQLFLGTTGNWCVCAVCVGCGERCMQACQSSCSVIHAGVVQTAYANGASTEFMRSSLGLDVKLAKTGVKNLQVMATAFDLGVYFEANGHGSVHFSRRFDSAACEMYAGAECQQQSTRACAVRCLQAVSQVRCLQQ